MHRSPSDFLGTGVFEYVKADLQENITVRIFYTSIVRTTATIFQGVRARYESVGNTADTLENLVKSERSESEDYATSCLVRLIRSVDFIPKDNSLSLPLINIRGLSLTCKALQYMQKDQNAQLYTCFQMSYNQVLRPHYSWVTNSCAYVSQFSSDLLCF
jgi:hypothetical protein